MSSVPLLTATRKSGMSNVQISACSHQPNYEVFDTHKHQQYAKYLKKKRKFTHDDAAEDRKLLECETQI